VPLTTRVPPPARRARAAALPPDERRAAIVAATMPLLIEHGINVTTRQIAEAAGIAEGTIFRVFVDKQELVDTAFDAALDASPDVAAIAAIPLELPLDDRLTAAVEVLQRRVTRLWQAMTAAGVTRAKDHRPPLVGAEVPEVAAIAALLAPDAERLRRSPVDVARLVRGVTFATTLPVLALDNPATAAEIVALVLDGVRAR
jgi:AcrR family transcriptional regulator